MNFDFFIGSLFGWMLGGFVMYLYIRMAGLFRTRKEFYAARRKRGLEVPLDWDVEEFD